MGKIKVIRVVFSILLVQLFTLSVNADEKADYLKLAQKVRQEVWSSTPADFQKRTVPDRYKNASAVILSYYRELSTDYYRKATADLVLNLRLTRQIDCTDMERMLIQINDKKYAFEFNENKDLIKNLFFKKELEIGFAFQDVNKNLIKELCFTVDY